MSRTATVTITSDISYTITDTVDNNTQRYSNSLGYGLTYNYGTGDPSGSVNSQVNAFAKNTGLLTASSSEQIDFTALNQSNLGSAYTIDYTYIKGLVIENRSTGTGDIIYLIASGSNAFTNLFNGGSGNIKINPSSTYMYTDPFKQTPVTSTNKFLYLDNRGSSSIDYAMITVGVSTGLEGSNGLSSIPQP